MKILFVLENYIPHIGGVEVVFKNLCEGLASQGNEIHIVTHRLKGTKKFEIINNVNVHRTSPNRYLFTFFSIPKVLKLAKKSDIIHTTTFNAAFPAWIASKLRRKKSIITVHEVWIGRWNKLTEMNWLNAKLHSLLEMFIYFLNFNIYACVSKSTQKQLINIGKDPKKTELVYNGIDYDHWNPKKYSKTEIRKRLNLKNEFIYLFYGRPGISKGLEYLLKAVPSISKNIPSSRLLAIVSKDDKKRYNEITNLIRKLGIKDNILLHDPVNYKDLPKFINSADCVVVPSLAEGFGFTAAESCAMDIPVVVSNTASLPEVVSGKFVLVKPKDPEAITAGIKLAYKNKFHKSKKKFFHIKDNIERYLDIYSSLIFK